MFRIVKQIVVKPVSVVKRVIVKSGRSISINPETDYVNAKVMCDENGKRLGAFLRLKSTKRFLRVLSQRLDMNTSSLTHRNHAGTWVHPCIVHQLAQWISPEFAVDVALWLAEWKFTAVNKARWRNALMHMNTVQPPEALEKAVQLALQLELGGVVEANCDFGRIDLLNATHVIEVKKAAQWKHAFGQVMAYGALYPKHQKCICLFGNRISEAAEATCKKNNIEVIYRNIV
jgi:hypothetical protein